MYRSMFRGLLVLAVVLASGFSPSVAASEAAQQKPVYWLDLSGSSSIAPDRVFFTANAGGFLEKIKWTRWGARKSVGRGNFGTTAPCNGRPCPNGPARLVLRKPMMCTPTFGNKRGKKIRVYRFGTLYYPNWDGKQLVSSVMTGWGACRQAYR